MAVILISQNNYALPSAPILPLLWAGIEHQRVDVVRYLLEKIPQIIDEREKVRVTEGITDRQNAMLQEDRMQVFVICLFLAQRTKVFFSKNQIVVQICCTPYASMYLCKELRPSKRVTV